MVSAKDVSLVFSTSGVTVLNIFQNGALTTILSTLAADLHFKENDFQWPLSIYALLHASLLLPCGRIADIIGSRHMFLFGTAWFAIWSIACGFAPNKVVFILFIAMTGVGAGANTPTGIGILSNHFEEGKSKDRAIAALGAAQGIGYVGGLIIGGFLCRTPLGWRAVFFVQGGAAFLFFVMGFFTIPHHRADRRYNKGFDLFGALISISGVALFIFALSYAAAASQGWKTPWIIVLLVVSLAITVFFVYYERRRERRDLSVIVPISVWSNSRAKMKPTVALALLCWASYNSVTYLFSVFWEEAHHLSPSQTAVRIAPTSTWTFLSNFVAGILLGLVPKQWIIIGGLLGGMGGALALALISFDSPYPGFPLVSLLLVGFNDAVYTIANLQLSVSLDADSQALAGGIFNVATRLGSSFGLSLSSTVLISVSQRDSGSGPSQDKPSPLALVQGIKAAGWSCFALSTTCLVIAALCLRDLDQKPAPRANGEVKQTPPADIIEIKQSVSLPESLAESQSELKALDGLEVKRVFGLTDTIIPTLRQV